MITRRNLLASAPAAFLVPAPAAVAAAAEPTLEQRIEAQARLLADLVRQAMPADAGRFNITVHATGSDAPTITATGYKRVWEVVPRLKAGGLWIEEAVELPIALRSAV